MSDRNIDGEKFFERTDLQELRRLARYWRNVAVNEDWKAAYERLAQAADVLDAFYGRSENPLPVILADPAGAPA